MTHMYFSAGAEGRISYGHLGRTNLFILCTAGIGHIAEKHGLSSHFYPDDSQLYGTGRRDSHKVELRCFNRSMYTQAYIKDTAVHV